MKNKPPVGTIIVIIASALCIIANVLGLLIWGHLNSAHHWPLLFLSALLGVVLVLYVVLLIRAEQRKVLRRTRRNEQP